MTMAPLESPFGDEELQEVHLNRAPLIKVLAQIQFPRLSVLTSPDVVQSYASRMRAEYPIIDELNNVVVTITPDGVQQQSPGGSKVWVLQSADGAWRVSVTETTLSVETTSYQSRTDFCDRLLRVLEPFIEAVGMPFITRLGVRYINRLERDEDLAAIPTLFCSPVTSAFLPLATNDVELQQSLTQSVYRIRRDDGLIARWALLPPNAVIEPTLEPVQSASFVFDLDSFRGYVHRTPPAARGIVDDAYALGGVAYRYFRWTVTRDFLTHFGGDL